MAYSRVYHSIVDDQRFETVYSDDAALASWLRLLLVADAMYPAPAPLPRTVRPRALGVLVTAGLVELVGSEHYRIHGLASEREKRSLSARNAAALRWQSPRIASKDEHRRDETSTAGARRNGLEKVGTTLRRQTMTPAEVEHERLILEGMIPDDRPKSARS
jgi:hypothetical protein